MPDTTDRAEGNDGMIVPSHGNGKIKPFQKGVATNPTGRNGLWVQVQQMCRTKSPEAVNKLVELMSCDDERVAMMAAQKVLEWAWGAPQPYKPGLDDGRMVLDLKSLSRAELTTLGNMVSRGAVRPAGADDGVVVTAVDETKPA